MSVPSLPAKDDLSQAIRVAAKRVLYPFLQYLCYGLLSLAILAMVQVRAVDLLGSAPQGFQATFYLWNQRLIFGQLPLFAIGVCFIGLIILSFWEKVSLVAGMLLLAWLSR